MENSRLAQGWRYSKSFLWHFLIRGTDMSISQSLLLTVMISDPDPAFANGVSEAKVTESNGVTGGQKVQQPSHKTGKVNHCGK